MRNRAGINTSFHTVLSRNNGNILVRNVRFRPVLPWGWDIPAQQWIFLINTVILTVLRVIHRYIGDYRGIRREESGNIPVNPENKVYNPALNQGITLYFSQTRGKGGILIVGTVIDRSGQERQDYRGFTWVWDRVITVIPGYS